MMADLVCDNVRLRKIAGRAKLAFQLVKECKIEIKLLIAWTVKRTDSR